jgi:5-formyltetrahydrofolate cyclo-ligase
MLLGREDVVENLPEDPWDQGVDAIVTDREWIDTH